MRVAILLLLATCCCAGPMRFDDVSGILTSLAAMDQRTDSLVTLDYQNMASGKDFTHDNAPNPFFKGVDQTVFSSDTYTSLDSLLAYYTKPDVDDEETMTLSWSSAIYDFINAAINTPVGNAAWQFLQQSGWTDNNFGNFEDQLYTLWFTLYSRNSVVGSSGFEAVYSGESQGKNVTRFANWIRMYKQEQAGVLNYHGWFTRVQDVQVSVQFEWQTLQEMRTSILLNSSPEFEFFAYTICAVVGGGSQCTFNVLGQTVTISASTLNKNGVTVIDECTSDAQQTGTTTKKPSNKDPLLQPLVDQMRAADVDKAADDQYQLNWGNKVVNKVDESPDPLFTFVDETLFQRPLYQKLIAMYNQGLFTASVCVSEPVNVGERRAIFQDFFNEIFSTEVFQLAYNYLNARGNAHATTIDDLKTFLFDFWYGTYSRCSPTLGSSGFEHVYSGEWKGSEIDGQHNWVRFYLLEKAGHINYYGYYSYDAQLTGTFQYTWDSYLKPTGGFLIGTSPAFDFCLLTVCALEHPGSNACQYSIDGFPLGVTSYTQSCDTGTCLSTAYPTN